MTTKAEGFKKRQEDTGWGKAFCHIIPFYFIYYGITRRTLTPIIYAFAGNLVLGFCFGFIYALINPNFVEENLEKKGRVLGLITTPLLAKKGIDQARKDAKSRLELN
tara:strand:- start:94 stop:414 length:321 start_codon:yes stop_codon:yes gene_type:complete